MATVREVADDASFCMRGLAPPVIAPPANQPVASPIPSVAEIRRLIPAQGILFDSYWQNFSSMGDEHLKLLTSVADFDSVTRRLTLKPGSVPADGIVGAMQGLNTNDDRMELDQRPDQTRPDEQGAFKIPPNVLRMIKNDEEVNKFMYELSTRSDFSSEVRLPATTSTDVYRRGESFHLSSHDTLQYRVELHNIQSSS